MSRCGQLELRQDTAPLLRQGHRRGLVRAKKPGTKSGTGAPLRRRFSCVAGPNRLKVTAAQLVLRGLSDAEMGIDLRDRRLSVGDRLPAFLFVVIWICELIRSLNNRYRHALKVLYNYDCVEQR